jgi:hypothetical protein
MTSPSNRARTLALVSILIAVFWFTNLVAVDHFPPFIDEMIHVHGSEQVFTQSPLSNADLGRQFTIWWMALFQAHLGSPIWISRAVTVLAGILGMAAMIGIGRLLGGLWDAVLAALCFQFSAYHFFFGRLALADPIAGAAVLLALYFAVRLSRRWRWIDALLTAICLFLAVGAKVSALPYLGIPLAAMLTLHSGARAWRKQIQWGIAAVGIAAALVAAFVLALRLFGHDFLSNSVSYALTNRGGTSLGTLFNLERILTNMQFTWTIYSTYLGALPTLFGLFSLVILAIKREFYLPLCFIGPLAVTLINQIQESRFLIVSVSILLLAGALLLARIMQTQKRPIRVLVVSLVIIWGAIQWLPFAVKAAQNPVSLPLPETDFKQYIRSDASGFGLPEVRTALQALAPAKVIGLLSNCQGLRYLALHDFDVECPNLNPSGENIPELLDLLDQNRAPKIFLVLEDLPYVPASVPGKLVTVVSRPGDGPTLTIYDLSPEA